MEKTAPRRRRSRLPKSAKPRRRARNGLGQASHPLRLNRLVLDAEPAEHFWHGPVVYDATHQRFWRFFSSGWHHGASYGSALQAEWSRDGFLSDRNTVTVSNETRVELSPQFGVAHVFPSGRVGIFIMGRSASALCFRFHYTDDGRTWGKIDVAAAARESLVPTGEMFTLPGGDVVLYGYGDYAGAGTSGLKYLRITGEGAAFTAGKCWASNPAFSHVEATVVKKSDAQWIAYGRDGRSGTGVGYVAWCSSSTNGIDFSAPTESGVNLGANPIKAIYRAAGDELWIYGCFRGRYEGPGGAYADGASGYGTPVGQRDGLAVMKTRFASAFAARGVVPVADRRWVDFEELPARATGQIQYTKDDRDRFWAVVSCLEDLNVGVNGDPQTTQMNVLLTPATPVVPRLQDGAPVPNVLHNPFFRRRFSTSGAKGVAAQLTDRWHWNGNGVATVNVQFPAVTDEMRKLIPGRPAYGMSLSSAGAGFAELHQEFPGQAAIKAFADRTATIEIWLSGDLPSNAPQMQVQFLFGTGGAAGAGYAAVNVPLHASPGGNGLWRVRRKFVMPTADGATFGSGCRVRVALVKSGPGGTLAWATTFYAGKLAFATHYSRIDRPDETEEDLLLDRYRQGIQLRAQQVLGPAHAPGTNVAVLPLVYPPMIARPTSATFLAAAAENDFKVNGNNCNANTTVTAESETRGYIRMEATVASGAYYPCVVGDATDPFIVLATGL